MSWEKMFHCGGCFFSKINNGSTGSCDQIDRPSTKEISVFGQLDSHPPQLPTKPRPPRGVLHGQLPPTDLLHSLLPSNPVPFGDASTGARCPRDQTRRPQPRASARFGLLLNGTRRRGELGRSQHAQRSKRSTVASCLKTGFCDKTEDTHVKHVTPDKHVKRNKVRQFNS